MPKLKFFADDGHGWLKVEMAKLVELGIASRISTYSYMKGPYVYLEEDRDAGLFIDAMKAKGITVEFDEHHIDGRSRIRSYESFVAPSMAKA